MNTFSSKTILSGYFERMPIFSTCRTLLLCNDIRDVGNTRESNQNTGHSLLGDIMFPLKAKGGPRGGPGAQAQNPALPIFPCLIHMCISWGLFLKVQAGISGWWVGLRQCARELYNSGGNAVMETKGLCYEGVWKLLQGNWDSLKA